MLPYVTRHETPRKTKANGKSRRRKRRRRRRRRKEIGMESGRNDEMKKNWSNSNRSFYMRRTRSKAILIQRRLLSCVCPLSEALLPLRRLQRPFPRLICYCQRNSKKLTWQCSSWQALATAWILLVGVESTDREVDTNSHSSHHVYHFYSSYKKEGKLRIQMQQFF